MTQRFHVSEHRQQRMISFLTKAMQNPSFFAQFVSQQNENNQVVRKKRRLPIHEYGDMHESMSPESSIENQMVAFQPSELGEAGARARVIEMFRSSDSQPATESSRFEGLVREADTSPNSGDSNMLNRQPRATLELNTKLSGIFSSAPIVTDVSANESLEAPPTSPQTFDMARVLSESKSLELYLFRVSSLESRRSRVLFDACNLRSARSYLSQLLPQGGQLPCDDGYS